LSHSVSGDPSPNLSQFCQHALVNCIAILLVGFIQRTPAEEHQAAYFYQEALQALSQKDDAAAIVAFRRAVTLDASLANAHYCLGMLYKKQERWQEAIKSFQEATVADPDYIEPYCELGEVFLNALAQVEPVIPLLQKAALIKPDHPRVRQILGTAYLRQNQTERAIHELQRACELNASDTESLYTLGLAYFQQSRFEMASSQFKQVIEQQPFHAKAHFSLGNSYLRMGKTAEGQKMLQVFVELNLEEEQMVHLKRLVRQDPENAEAWYQLGRLHTKRKQWTAATEAFKKSTALEPDAVRGYKALGFIFFQTKSYDNALEMYRQTVVRQPDNATYRNSLGAVYLMLEQYSEAIKQYHEAIRLDASESRFYFYLSKAYEQAGDKTNAEKAYLDYERLQKGEGEAESR